MIRTLYLNLIVTNSLENTISILVENGSDDITYLMCYLVDNFNNDSNLGMVVNNGDGNVIVLLENGRNDIIGQATFSTGSGPVSVVAGDLNHDNNPDLAVANFDENTGSILYENGIDYVIAHKCLS